MIENADPNDSTVNAVEMWVVNTDAQALSKSLAKNRLNIGLETSRYCVCSSLDVISSML